MFCGAWGKGKAKKWGKEEKGFDTYEQHLPSFLANHAGEGKHVCGIGMMRNPNVFTTR